MLSFEIVIPFGKIISCLILILSHISLLGGHLQIEFYLFTLTLL